MKRLYYFILCLLSACLLLSSCQGKPATNNTPITPSPTPIKTDDSIWYSEDADVLGRIWLGMTEKEVYDVLVKYNITIEPPPPIPNFECDEYGAISDSSNSYYKKHFYTEGHQYFWFDKDDRLAEICYFDQIHYTDSPINEEFITKLGVQRRDSYEDMINAYGEPDKVINIGAYHESHMYRLENGDYLHFVYPSTSLPIESIHYSKTPYVFSRG